MSNTDNNLAITVKNKGGRPKLDITDEERRERLLEQKRRWFRDYRANEENRKQLYAYNVEKKKIYRAMKKASAVATF
jgi:hypothetical protein